MTAFDQRAGYAHRVLVYLRVRDLVRHEHRILVRDEEINVIRQVGLRHTNDVHAEHLAAHALGDRLAGEHVHARELVRGADQLVHFARQVQVAVVVRHQRVVQRLRRVRNFGDDVGLGRLVAFGQRARHGDKTQERILVRRRGGLFIQLQTQHVGCVLDEVLVKVVALVDCQRERLVLRHGQLLHHVLHFGHVAVALETAVAVVIDLLDRDRGVYLERFDAGQVKGLGGFALDEGCAGEYLRDLVGVFGSKVDSHKYNTSCLYRLFTCRAVPASPDQRPPVRRRSAPGRPPHGGFSGSSRVRPVRP